MNDKIDVMLTETFLSLSLFLTLSICDIALLGRRAVAGSGCTWGDVILRGRLAGLIH